MVSNKLQENRFTYIDYAKTFCLYLILFCHIPPVAGSFHVFCYSFHVQIFFFFAGVFFQNRQLKDVITRSAKTLLLPYLFWNFIIIIFHSILGVFYGFSFRSGIIDPILGTLLGSSARNAPFELPAGPSWFLPSLFIARVIFSLLLNVKTIWKLVIIIAASAIYWLSYQYHFWIPFSIPSTILGLPFIIVGYLCKNMVKGLNNISIYYRLCLTLLLLAIIPFSINNGLANMYDGVFGNNFFLFIFFGVCGSLFFSLLFSFIKFKNKFISVIIESSCFFICMHTIIMEYISLITKKYLGFHSELMLYEKFFVFFLTIFALYFVAKFLKNIFPRLNTVL